jgi:hypothetical protein
MSYWRFCLDNPFVWQAPINPRHGARFTDHQGRTWLTITEDGAIAIAKDYAWNGCSPGIAVWDWGVLGLPQGINDEVTGKPKTYYASLVHDALYQFMNYPDMPYSRKEMDQLFLVLMQQSQFSLATVYYWAVRSLGGGYRTVKQWLNID